MSESKPDPPLRRSSCRPRPPLVCLAGGAKTQDGLNHTVVERCKRRCPGGWGRHRHVQSPSGRSWRAGDLSGYRLSSMVTAKQSSGRLPGWRLRGAALRHMPASTQCCHTKCWSMWRMMRFLLPKSAVSCARAAVWCCSSPTGSTHSKPTAITGAANIISETHH